MCPGSPLSRRLPKPRGDHRLAQRFALHHDALAQGQLFACEGWSEIGIAIADELQSSIEHLAWHPPVRGSSALSGDYRGCPDLAVGSPQPFDLPHAELQGTSDIALAQGARAELLEGFQPSHLGHGHGDGLHKAPAWLALWGHLYLAGKGTFLLGADTRPARP